MCNAIGRRYPAAMPAAFRQAPPALRLVALLLLALGLLVKPVLVGACEVEDLRLAGAGTVLVDDDGDHPGGDCCPGQTCGECCTVATPIPTAPAAGVALAATPRPKLPVLAGLATAPARDEIRPPIRA